MRGVRTYEDMQKLADSTRTPDYAARNAAMMKQELAGRPYYATPGEKGKHYLAVMEALKDSPLPEHDRHFLAQSHQEMATSLIALQEANLGYTVTMYGSARIPETSFAYPRARYTAGVLAKEHGISGMTGGGVSLTDRRGIMDAGNRGFFEAGGKSVGVSIVLPFEAASNPFQTTKLIHANYSTRKEVLRRSNAFIIEEGGLGTLDEAFELLCHLQCEKQAGAPVYIIGSGTYGPVRGALQKMVNQGLMSAKDMNLFKLVEDPRIAIKGIAGHKASLEAATGLQPGLLSTGTGDGNLLRPATTR
jgi:uncharacterized protein (TIGR00730 family)